jgi:hypothetical protein
MLNVSLRLRITLIIDVGEENSSSISGMILRVRDVSELLDI